jgi:hypothetical protein
MILVGFAVVCIGEALYLLALRKRFRHWPCPRCKSEWPGNKKEKDPACRMCGLRLHQLAPCG